MSYKLNCWEFRNCGLEPGGILAKIHGECPVPREMKKDGVNGGIGAGRSCWAVVNSCHAVNRIAGRNRRRSCLECEFYRRVVCEEDLQSTLCEEDLLTSQKIHI